jgi:chromosome partitioning protein
MIVTLYSTKSSTKTSIAVSTAVYLLNKGEDVIFADLDAAQASASEWLDYRDSNEKLKRIPCIKKSGKYIARELLELKNRSYDYIVADCAGHADINGRSALTVTDIAIVPVLPLSLSLITLENTLNSCINAQVINPNLKVVVVLTGCHSNHLVKDTQEARSMIIDLIKDEPNFKLANATITARKVWNDIVVDGKGITESANQQAIIEFTDFMKEIF